MSWWRAAFIFAIAALLRFSDLDQRPMHADEAVQAARLDNISYSAADYHGTVLPWMTRLAGVRSFASATERRVRAVPAFVGTVLSAAAGPAGLLIAVSPAFIWYSRDYIPEILLILFTLAMLFAGRAYLRNPSMGWSIALGACVGLMYATKETAAIAIVCAVASRWRELTRVQWRHWLAGAAVASVITAALLGGFNTAFSSWASRSLSSVHSHGPFYYAALLIRTEWPLMLLAVFAVRRHQPLAWWTAMVFVAYSAIPYKTPWCALTPLLGVALLAGYGTRDVGVVFTAAAACALLLISPDGVWSYSETSSEVVAASQEFAKLQPATEIQVISKGHNLWPLPWYLRRLTNVHWWTGVPHSIAPVIVAAPEFEPALLHAMYELPPPGNRQMYVPLFNGDLHLRPDVELRGYIARSLREATLLR